MSGGGDALRSVSGSGRAATGGPPTEDVLQGGAPARRHRTVLAVVALSGLALTGFLLTGPAAHTTRPGPAPRPTGESGPDFALGRVAFTDAEFGYVLLRPCRAARPCGGTWSLLRTTDSGRGWHRVDSPLDGRVAGQVTVYARGRRDVALVVEGTRFVSTDTGVTWRAAPPVTAAGPTGTVPAGDAVGYYCPVAAGRPACPARLSAFDPVTGVSRPLADQPPLAGDPDDRQVSAVAGGDQVWVLDTPADGTPRLTHSVDGGLRWATAPMPAGVAWFDPELLLAADGGRLYLVNRNIRTSRIQQVWRLADPAAGRWVSTPPPEDAQDAQILPDGELRYTDLAGNAWLSRTTGRVTMLVPAPTALMDGRRVNVNVAQVVDGALVATPVVGLRGDRILVSTDSGRHWQVHPVRP